MLPVLLETNIIDLIIKSELGEDPFIKEFVSFYDNLVKDITCMLDKKHHKGIRNFLIGKVTNFDSGNYMNPIGEIAALHSILENSRFTLEQIEYKLPNRKRADLLLNDPLDNHKVIVEVLNIHVPDNLGSEELKEFLLNKVREKIDKEELEDKFLKEWGRQIFLPIIWTFDFEQLLPLEKFSLGFDKDCKTYFPNSQVLGFCSLIQLIAKDGTRVFRFSSVMRNLKDWKQSNYTCINE